MPLPTPRKKAPALFPWQPTLLVLAVTVAAGLHANLGTLRPTLLRLCATHTTQISQAITLTRKPS